jgi:hypothetical protein
MADPTTIRASTRVINGITTRLETNTDTGAAILYQENGLAGRTVLASGSAIGDKWTVTNAFAAVYSTRVGSTLTLTQAQNAFAKDFQTISNNDRASLINTWSPTNTKTYLATTAKVPGIIDPKTGLKTGQTLQSQAKAPVPPAPRTQPPLAPDPGADPLVDPQTGTDISGATLSTLSTAFSEGEKANTAQGYLRYPRDTEVTNYDYLMIQPIEYVPGFSDSSAISVTITRASQRISEKKSATGPRIYLPMTPGISESNSVGWGEDRLNPVQAAFGQAAYESIGAISEDPLDLNSYATAMNYIRQAGSSVANSPGLDSAIRSYFAGQAVGANFLGRSGIVLNPNLELLFQGPKLRSFRYNFRFTPRDDKEAKEVRKIIKVFKKTMAVRQVPGSLFLGVPSIYELRYIFKSDETGDHPFLNKIKPCALTAFNVNYTPDGSYMTYQDGSMTSYTVDMQFDEIEPIYNEDIDDVDGPTTGY